MADGTWPRAVLQSVGTSERHELCASLHPPLLGIIEVLIRHIVRATHNVQIYCLG